MDNETWVNLTSRQRHVMLVAMYLRNALEDFHVAHLSDAQMKILNQTIREALYRIITLIETNDHDPMTDYFMANLVSMIPDYWEIPGEPDDTDSAAA